MPTEGAQRPEERDASGIGFYFNADDTWHSDSPAPRRVWDPAWIAPPPSDWPDDPPVPRRRSGLAVAFGLALVAGAAVVFAWSLTPARRLSPPVRQPEPPGAVLVPPLPVEPPAPAPAAAPPVKSAPARTADPTRRPAAATPAPHHRRHLRTAHHRHGAAHPGARPHSKALKRPAAQGSRSAAAGARRSWRPAHPAAHHPRRGHPLPN